MMKTDSGGEPGRGVGDCARIDYDRWQRGIAMMRALKRCKELVQDRFLALTGSA
jgi:hypothetical protein